MQFLLKKITFRKYQISVATIIWFTFALVATIIQLNKKPLDVSINNYLIFKGVFWHTSSQINLFSLYASEYFDCNHYGPFFSIIIAPFAVLPNVLGCFLWCMVNAAILFYAVKQLPISEQNKHIILLIGALEMMTATHNVQFNPMLTSWIILSYVLVKKEKDFWATLFIIAGFGVKLYGIVGLAFFLFSAHKQTFVLSCFFWAALLFCLPMLLSSPQYILQSYKDWYNILVEKNDLNQESPMQGMTVMRIIKKVFQVKNLKDIYILGTAAIFYLLPMLRFKEFKNTAFQLSYLAFLLIGVVIFSSSAEAATFVIAMMGVGIWFVNTQEKSIWVISLLVFAIIFTSLSTTDLFPKNVKINFIRPYAIKALPCFFIWLVLAYQLLFKKFALNNINE
jgi:Glycosyltransferase family 87